MLTCAYKRLFTTMSRKQYIGAIDQGTTSSRFILFDTKGQLKYAKQIPFVLETPRHG